MGPTDKNETSAERIVRLETKLDFLISQLDRLPPSPTCVSEHQKIEQRFIAYDERLDEMDRWRNRAIGAILVINIVGMLLMEKIAALINFK